MNASLLSVPAVLAQRTSDVDTGAAASAGLGSLCVGFFVYLFFSYCLYLIFQKDSVTPWWAFVPILNTYGIIKLVGREPWWIILLLIPCVSIVIAVILMLDLARSFGKDVLYGLGLLFLGFIFLPMLAFGSATYVGPAAARARY